MKLLFCILCLLQFLPKSLGLYTGFIWQDSSVISVAGNLTAWSNVVCSYDGKMVYAEIENGNSYHSTDSGVTWTLTTGPSCFSGKCELLAASGDGKYVYKGSFNSLFRSSDSGASFGTLGAPYTFPLALKTDETGQYVLVSEYFMQSRLLLSSDYGGSFSATGAPELDYRAIAAGHDVKNIILVSSGLGSNNHVRIHYSHNMGTTFAQATPDFYGGWNGDFSAACDWDCKYGVVSGPYNEQGAGIWYTADYGETWQKTSTNSYPYLADTYSVVVDTTGRYVLAGLAGSDAFESSVHFSNDYGHTWSESANKKGAYVSLAAPKNFTNAYAVSGVKSFSVSAPYNLLQGTAIIPPTAAPTAAPSKAPTYAPSNIPTAIPTTAQPSFAPTTAAPSATPTFAPSAEPTTAPTFIPTALPTFRPSAIPTTSPTHVPTAAPTSATRTQVTLNCNATLSGIDASSFDEDYINGFESAISGSVLEGKTADSQVISVENQENTGRRLFSFVGKAQKVIKSTSTGIILKFNVSAIMEETGLSSSTAFDVMYENLKTAFTSGVIQAETNSYVEDLKGGSYTPISVLSIASSKSEVTYEVIQEPNNDSSDDEISTTNIIIIVVVILGTFFIVLLAALFYYFYCVQLGYTQAAKEIPAENVHRTEMVSKQVVVQDGSMNI